jgi:uncharacterized membrane protein
MAEPAENYISQKMASTIRKQAFRVWTIGSLVVFAWAFLIVASPLLKANNLTTLSSPLYYFFSFLCHQIPERSLYFAGFQLAVCSRCFGIYFGLLLGFIIYPLWRNIDDAEPLPRFWLFFSLIPISIDWSLTFLNIWQNTHLSRLLTGTIVGIACATYIIPALVEIMRNLTYRRD